MKRKYRWIIFGIVLIMFAVFSSMIKVIPLTNRSMVVCVGIDLGEEKPFLVSAQIILPNTQGQSASYSTKIVSVESDTFSEGMNDISRLSGKPSTLTHCGVIMLGEDFVKAGEAYVGLSYLVGNNYLSDDTNLYMTRGKASELLNKKVAIDGSTNAYLQNIITLHTQYSDIASKNVQDFFVAYHQKGNINYLPIIDLIEANPSTGTSVQSAQSETKEYLYKLTSTVVIRRNVYVCELSAEESKIVNIINAKVNSGNITSKGQNNENVTLFINGKTISKKFNLKQKKIEAKINFKTVLKEIADFENVGKYVDRDKITDSEVDAICEDVKQKILKFYKKAQELDIDVFAFTQSFFARYGDESDNLTLADIKLDLEITLDWT